MFFRKEGNIDMRGIYITLPKKENLIYGSAQKEKIEKYAEIKGTFSGEDIITSEYKLLNDVDVIFSGWGMPKLTKELLDNAPNLKAVFYAAGSVKGLVAEEFWERNIVITSAYEANGIAVAEFTLAEIIYSLKMGWQFMGAYKSRLEILNKDIQKGGYMSTVGIISLGAIGKKVCSLLKNFDVDIIVCDPYVSQETAEEMGVSLCTLEELFERADVASLHTPLLPETVHMITKKHFMAMKKNSAFINTSRGAVVNETEMIEALQLRPDLYAVLDVTAQEPLNPESPILHLENVVLTPHIAGAVGEDGRRMGQYMADEFERFVGGEPLKYSITKEKMRIMA